MAMILFCACGNKVSPGSTIQVCDQCKAKGNLMGIRELKDRLQPDCESVTIGKRYFDQCLSMHASILVVLNWLQLENKTHVNATVIKDCIRELRRYEN